MTSGELHRANDHGTDTEPPPPTTTPPPHPPTRAADAHDLEARAQGLLAHVAAHKAPSSKDHKPRRRLRLRLFRMRQR